MGTTPARVGVVSILGLIAVVLGILVPILWDRYKTRTALELQLLSSTTIVQSDATLPKLRLFYGEQAITGMTKIRYALINTGRTSLATERVVTAPWVDVSDSSEILEVTVDRLVPPDLQFVPQLDSARQRVSLVFPLFNPGDRAEFSILAAGPPPPLDAGARITGLSQLTVIDRSDELTGSDVDRPRLTWTFYLAASTSVLSLLLFLGFFGTLVAESEARDLFAGDLLKWPSGATRPDYEGFINTVFSTKSDDELRKVRDLVAQLPDQQPPTPEQDEQLRVAVKEMADALGLGIGVTVMFGILTLAAAFFAISRFV